MLKNIKGKQIVIMVISILFFALFISLSYGYAKKTLFANKKYIFTASENFEITLTELNELDVVLENSIPQLDSEGMQQDGYSFIISNPANIPYTYYLYLEDAPIGSGKSRIEDQHIKIYLNNVTREFEVGPVLLSTVESDDNGYLIDEGRVNSREDVMYNLKLWVNYYATNEEADKVFSKKIKIIAEILSEDGSNTPLLADGMIPVTYDEGSASWVYADDSNNNWYDYDKQMWANAVTLRYNKAEDLTGNDNHGDIIGTSIKDNQVIMDGTSNYIDCGLESYSFGQAFSTVVKFKLLSTPTAASYIIGNAEAAGFYIHFVSGGKLTFGIHNSSDYQSSTTTVAYTPDDLWHEVALTFDGTNILLYMDGVQVASKTMTAKDMKVATTPVYVAANPGASTVSEYGNIAVEQVQIYNRTLAEDEVVDIYTTNAPTNTENLLVYYNFAQELYNYEIGDSIPIEDISTMWVWIPRYEYQYTNLSTTYAGGTKALPGEIKINFISVNQVEPSDPNVYKIPEGFTFGEEELSGFWIGKFESSSPTGTLCAKTASTTNCNKSSITPYIIPNVASWRYIAVGYAFNATRLMQSDYANTYGFNSNDTSLDIHLSKNTEWGAVAMLSQSKFGKYGNENYTGANKEVYENKSSTYITGMSNGAPSSTTTKTQVTYDTADTGVGASTTGTIYGVYDMAAGAWDYVMGNYTGVVGSSSIGTMPEDKYYDKYTSTTIASSYKPGDAIYETSAWYSDSATFITSSSSYYWMLRGATIGTGTGAGVFAYGRSAGATNAGWGFRISLKP